MQLHRQQSEIADRGAQLVVIGNGTPNFIAGFREQTGYRGPLYTDPSRESYRALELKRSIGSVLNARSAIRAFSAIRQGHRQRRTQGDAWQQGGLFLVSTDGEILFSHRSQFAGDKPDMPDILAALDRAAPAL